MVRRLQELISKSRIDTTSKASLTLYPECQSRVPRADVQLENSRALLLPTLHAGLSPPQHPQVPRGQVGHPELHRGRDQRHHRGGHLQRDQPQTRPGLHVLLHPLDQVKL